MHAVGIVQRSNKVRAKHLEIYGGGETLQMIAQIAQPFQPIINIKKARLSAHRLSSNPFAQMESETSVIGEFLEASSFFPAGQI